MPKGKKVRVRMTGTTVWTVRPGDIINVDANMARRWERGGLAKAIGKGKKRTKPPVEPVKVNKPEEVELSLAELKDICRQNDLPTHGNKTDIAARIIDSGLELKSVDEPELDNEFGE